MQLKKLAQCTMLVTNNSGGTLLIDPGRYNLDSGRLTADTVPTAQTIVITHRHTDHFDMSIIKSLLRRRILTFRHISTKCSITSQESINVMKADYQKRDQLS